MRVTITKLRQELFRLFDSLREGELLEFSCKGTVFQVVPEARPAKLGKLTRQCVVAPAGDFEVASRAMFAEMQAEWEKDWAEL